MVTLNPQQLPAALPPATTANTAVSLTITQVTPPSAPAPQSASPTPLQATVIPNPQGSPANTLTLRLPNGTTLTATLPQGAPVPAPGSKIQLPPNTPQTPAAPLPNQPLLARTLPTLAPLPNTPTPTPPAAPPTALPTLTLTLPPQLTPIPILPPLPTPASLLAPSLPAGPLPLTLSPSTPPLPTATATLQLTTPTSGTLTTPGQKPVAVTLPANFPLPLRQPLPVTVLPNPAQPNQPTILLSHPVGTPAASLAPPPGTLVTLTPPPANTPPNPPPLGTPILARVLPPSPAQPTIQPLLLANGRQAVLQLPPTQQPLPTGSTLVVEFSTLTSPAQVVRIQPATPQQQQPQTSANPQTAGPVTAQTPQAVLPAGTILQGTITGQNQQGAPLLTLSQPPALSGQTIALAPTTGQQAAGAEPFLPNGTVLSIKLESPTTLTPQTNLTGTVLHFTLPPAAARSHTLTHLGTTWGALLHGLKLLEHQSPQLAQTLKQKLPQLENLLPGLLTFTNALRTNTPEDALGHDLTTLLKSMGTDVVPDLQHLSQLQQKQDDTQWRATLFPYIENPQDDPQQGGFFWRREKEDDPRSPTSTRFILQLNLSQMGPLQLDGLITYPEVWLKLRRTTPPEPDFVQSLQSLVSSTLESFGLNGGISVEVTPTFPINPLQQLIAQSPNPLPTSA